MDRGTWQAIVHGVTKESDMTEYTQVPQAIEYTFSYVDGNTERDEKNALEDILMKHCEELRQYRGSLKTKNRATM